MKKIFFVLLAAMIMMVLCVGCMAEVATEPPVPVFTVNVTHLVIALMGVVFNILLAWIIRAVIPPLKKWLNEHATTLQKERAWTMIYWLVEAAEQTITGYAKGSERLAWVQAQLRARGIEVDLALIETAVWEMKKNASQEIKRSINDDDEKPQSVSLDDGK